MRGFLSWKLAAGLILSLIAFLLASCGAQSTESPPPAQSGQSSPPGETAQSQGESDGKGSAPSEYLIGVTLPLSGGAAAFGEFLQYGAELAIEEINSAGGIDGVPLKLAYEDGLLEPKASTTAFQKLVDVHKVPVVISGGSSVVMAQAPLAREHRVVLANIAAQSAELRNLGEWVFTFIPTSDLEASALADLMMDRLGLKEVAIIHVDNDYGNDSSNAFTEAVEKKGGKVVAREKHPLGASDMRTQLLKIKAANPEAIVPFSNVTEFGHVVRQIREMGMESQILGTTYGISPDNFQIAGDAMNGIVGSAVRFDPGTSDLAQKFFDTHVAKYGKEPTVHGAIVYDTLKILAEAIKNKGYDAEGIKEHLFTVKDFPGVMGPITMDQDGMSSFPISSFRIEDGKVVDF